MVAAVLLGLAGGFTYTLIVLNPGFRYSKLGINAKDFLVAVVVNSILGAVAGFLGWSLSAGEVPPPRSFAVYLLFGVGGGSLIQSLALAIASKESRATLDRTLEAVEHLSTALEMPKAEELRKVTRSLRDTTSPKEQQKLVDDLISLVNSFRGLSAE